MAAEPRYIAEGSSFDAVRKLKWFNCLTRSLGCFRYSWRRFTARIHLEWFQRIYHSRPLCIDRSANTVALMQVFLFCFPGRRNKAAECLIIIGGSALCSILSLLVWQIFISDQEMVALVTALVSVAITISIYGPLELMDIPRRFFATMRTSSGRTGRTCELAGADAENASQHSIVPLGRESAQQLET